MKDAEGFKYGQQVSFRGTRGRVLGRPRNADGKYLIACDGGGKKMILACELAAIPQSGPARFIAGPDGSSLIPNPEWKDG